MVITYNGENYFKIQAGELVILVDPANQRSFKGATLILSTLKPPLVTNPGNEFLVIDHQGEYEIQGIHIDGWSTEERGSGQEKTIYRFELDDITVVVLGHLSKEPKPETMEFLQDVDVLITPVGGKPYLSPENAAKLIRQLEPALVIPALYQNIKPFLKEIDQEKCEIEEKLTFKKKDLKPGAMIIKCLKQ